MHDPLTMVGSIRFLSRRLAGHRLDVVDVWHEEPDGRDAGTVCGNRGLWRHWSHLRFRVIPLRRLRRRVFTVCEWCGQPGTFKRPVNVSHDWYREKPLHWWYGERGLFHRECSTIESASRRCVCEHPEVAGRFGTGPCARCQRFVDYRQAELRAPRRLALELAGRNRRPTPDDSEKISAAFRLARETEDE